MPKGRQRASLESRFWSKVRKGEGCWEWTGYCFHGLGYGMIRRPGDNGRLLTHRVSWEMAYGAIPAGLLVCHRCDNRKCVRPDHLFLGTHKDNTRDMVSKGRHCHGTAIHNAKLDPEKVHAAREALARGERPTAIARRFGVRHTAITNLLPTAKRRTWAHV